MSSAAPLGPETGLITVVQDALGVRHQDTPNGDHQTAEGAPTRRAVHVYKIPKVPRLSALQHKDLATQYGTDAIGEAEFSTSDPNKRAAGFPAARKWVKAVSG
jgi:hypothetical protein